LFNKSLGWIDKMSKKLEKITTRKENFAD